MKKLIAFIAALLVVGTAVFADVSVKDLGDGTAEVTFFYGNPRATEVVIAGTWTDWQNAAEPMTKVEKGWEYKKVLPVATEMRYKFISDGNWTTDLKAPDFVDDGFGGKNGFVDVAAMAAASKAAAAGAPAAAPSAKIKFMTWSMIGTQAQFRTSAVTDASKKGLSMDNATIGAKSYSKLTGNFIGNNPFFVELALAETGLDPVQDGGQLYLRDLDEAGTDVVTWNQGLIDLVNGLAGHPVSYLARTTDNSETSAGPGSNPFLGHLKFGFNTRYVNYLTGFNYAKPEISKSILLTTVDGNWDAGYQHMGGFNVFSLGDGLRQIGDAKINFVFAPNKSADRKGTKYGLWTIAGVEAGGVAAEAQYNAFYTGETLFSKPFEHDVIVGAKGKVAGVDVAAQAVVNVYENLDRVPNGSFWDMMGYTGYSRSAIKFSDGFDPVKHLAGTVQASYKLPEDFAGFTLGYRFRGLESNMLYVCDHHNDMGKDTQTAQLGYLNSQRISLDGYVKAADGLTVSFAPAMEMPLTVSDWDEYYALYGNTGLPNGRWNFNSKDSMKLETRLGADYDLSSVMGKKSSVSVYGKGKYNTEDADKFAGYDSSMLFSNAGLKFTVNEVSSAVKALDFYYGLDNTNDNQMFNTFVVSAALPMEIRTDVSFALRSLTPESSLSDNNYPFGFAIGVSKKINRMYKPTVYAQFVYDMDPYKNFGDGQDALNLDGYAVGSKVKYNGDSPAQDAVEVYNGWAACRLGLRWDL
ncbi:MAG: glycogen-binding domain-containing protein [Spirochaetales bacterium]|nr:glycogen-binding domain-containing protein [Spirochaetales bacterium]